MNDFLWVSLKAASLAFDGLTEPPLPPADIETWPPLHIYIYMHTYIYNAYIHVSLRIYPHIENTCVRICATPPWPTFCASFERNTCLSALLKD